MQDDLDAREMEMLRSVLRVARSRVLGPILRKIGLDIHNAESVLPIVESFFDVRDSFNETFLPRCWVAFPGMDVAAAAKALNLARSGHVDQADEVLVQAYAPDAVFSHLRWMRRVKCFEKRHELALLACADYKEERYHACIPVTLALLDGMGQEMTGAGFLRQGVRFARQNSFLEIGPGLTELIRMMTASRGKTTTENITCPLRHGILHGTDLGYANRLVAAKAWAALIAVGRYAKLREQPVRSVNREPIGLAQSLRELADAATKAQRTKALLASWRPRKITDDMLKSPAMGTPERIASDLLTAWVAGHFGKMAECTRDGRNTNPHALAGQIRGTLSESPKEVTLSTITDHNFAVSTVSAKLRWDDAELSEIDLRLWHEDDAGFAPVGDLDAEWRVVSLWPLEAILHERRAQLRKTRNPG